jgi:NADH-quinone oxidoreductase subunit C
MSPWEGAHYVLPGDEKAKGQEQGAPTPAPAAPPPPKASEAPAPKVDTPKTTDHPGKTGAGEGANAEAKKRSPSVKKGSENAGGAKVPASASSGTEKPRAPRKTAAQKLARSTSGRSTRRRTACCAWCWSWTARSSSAAIRISACCIAAPKS